MPKKELTARDEAGFTLMTVLLNGVIPQFLPEGWVHEIKGAESPGWSSDSTKQAILEITDSRENPTVRIEIHMSSGITDVEKLLAHKGLMKREDVQIDPEDLPRWKWEYDKYDYIASGHVFFKSEKGIWLTYDRTGVDDSFYIHAPDLELPDWGMRERVQEFRGRIKESLERRLRSTSVPGIPFMVTPELKAEITKKLKAGKAHSFHPSGFGTGYTISTRKDRYSKANPEAAKFFEVSTLFVSTYDAD